MLVSLNSQEKKVFKDTVKERYSFMSSSQIDKELHFAEKQFNNDFKFGV